MVDFCKFEYFRWLSCDNSGKNYRSDLPMSEKDASWWDLNLSGQKFSSKINSSAGIFEKPKKMAKIADFAHFEPLWSLNANFAGHLVCRKMLGVWSGFTCRSMRWGCSAHSGPAQDFTNSPHLVHTPTIHFLAKEN